MEGNDWFVPAPSTLTVPALDSEAAETSPPLTVRGTPSPTERAPVTRRVFPPLSTRPLPVAPGPRVMASWTTSVPPVQLKVPPSTLKLRASTVPPAMLRVPGPQTRSVWALVDPAVRVAPVPTVTVPAPPAAVPLPPMLNWRSEFHSEPVPERVTAPVEPGEAATEEPWVLLLDPPTSLSTDAPDVMFSVPLPWSPTEIPKVERQFEPAPVTVTAPT